MRDLILSLHLLIVYRTTSGTSQPERMLCCAYPTGNPQGNLTIGLLPP